MAQNVKMRIMQGNQFALPLTGVLNGEPLDMDTVECVEIYVDTRRKVYPGEVLYSADGEFLYPLTQEETFAFNQSIVHIQVRTKFKGNPAVVLGCDVGDVYVEESVSKEVL